MTRADAVFVGRVVSQSKIPRKELESSPWSERATFKVLDSIKGRDQNLVQMLNTEWQAACGVRLKYGKTFVIYGQFDPEDNKWYIVEGHRYDPGDKEYLEFLRNAANRNLDTVVSGMLTPFPAGVPDTDRYANTEVVLEGQSSRRTVITDEKGRYNFSNVEPGAYTVKYMFKIASFPLWFYREPKKPRLNKDMSFEFDIRIEKGDHDYRYFEIMRASSTTSK